MGDKTCPQCGTKLGWLKIGLLYYTDGKRFCSIKCKNSYVNKNQKEVNLEKIKMDYELQPTTIINERGKKSYKVFIWTFIILESLFIILALPYAGQKPFLGFGSLGGFILVTVFCLFVAFLVLLFYGANKLGTKIGEIIDATHKELTKKEKI